MSIRANNQRVVIREIIHSNSNAVRMNITHVSIEQNFRFSPEHIILIISPTAIHGIENTNPSSGLVDKTAVDLLDEPALMDIVSMKSEYRRNAGGPTPVLHDLPRALCNSIHSDKRDTNVTTLDVRSD